MIDGLKLDPKKPFFAIAYGYLCALHGNLELSSRWLTRETQKFASTPGAIESLAASIEGKRWQERIPMLAKGAVTTLIDDLALVSKATDHYVMPTCDELAAISVGFHSIVLKDFVSQIAGAAIIVAWDTTIESHTHEPEWEFLRHCRNAAAHQGRFHFLHEEPRRPASWRGLQIERSLEGRDLFRVDLGNAFLGPGDVIVLLSDLEVKLKP